MTTLPTDLPAAVTAAVTAWNDTYLALAREHRLKDASPGTYVELVYDELMATCHDDATIALMVFRDPRCEGGWMHDGVEARIRATVRQRLIARGPLT